ncbi:UDP-glycosyltransferase 92A1-like [Camellia sinensis]|uniref:UDP-glycosyltransferase 92A1-like n=1 Tax=Camellia sinensis TaxID=4442 RepID=UPI0010367FB9|nr:UDP-glycosyltransferase 92A1-like [Camellia sinensis]
MTERKENIVMFPFMAQGHIIPFLALALELEKKNGYTITFVNTRLNIKKLRPSFPPNSSIRLLEIPFNSSDHSLPPDTENTGSLPLLLHLIVISPALEPAFRDLISSIVLEHGRPPLCIISDMFFGWSTKVTHEFGAFRAIFNASGSYGMAVFHSLWLNLPYKKVNSEEFRMPGFLRGHQVHTKQLPEHFQVAVPVRPILSSLGSKARVGDDAEATMHLCMKWLDSKPTNSVLYVAFGSQSAPLPSRTIQLAIALEACGKNFIWVVWSPPSNSVTDHEHNDGEWLSRGFESHIEDSNKGLLVQQWAPQLEILSHKSLCVFLTYCGWNSVLEALSNGVPMLSWPIGAEQNFNAKMLEEEIGLYVGVASGSSEINHKDWFVAKVFSLFWEHSF